MEMQYRLNQEKLLSEHRLNQEILIHCIARLNKKINMLFGKIKKAENTMNNHNYHPAYTQSLQSQIDDYTREQYQLKKKRQSILHVVMSAYRLSLDDVKKLIKKADQEKFPTYKTIDNIVEMIECMDYSLL